jgi:shikimate kinase
MSVNRQIRNLALIGFMGTGKSTIGRQVAAQLHFKFIDTDETIESRAGRRISEIFAQAGETVFRQFESQLLGELDHCEGTVIATGGGFAAQPGSLDRLKAHALVVCLWASPEAIWQRVRNQTHRPLLEDPDPQRRIRELMAAREPFYRQADVLVNTEMRTLKEVAYHVRHQFELACAPLLPP